MEEKKIKVFNLFFFFYIGLVCIPVCSYAMRLLVNIGYSPLAVLVVGFLVISSMALLFVFFWLCVRKELVAKLEKSNLGLFRKYVDFSE